MYAWNAKILGILEFFYHSFVSLLDFFENLGGVGTLKSVFEKIDALKILKISTYENSEHRFD